MEGKRRRGSLEVILAPAGADDYERTRKKENAMEQEDEKQSAEGCHQGEAGKGAVSVKGDLEPGEAARLIP